MDNGLKLELATSNLKMAAGNKNKHEMGETSGNQDSYLISASYRIFQDLTDIYINPEESVSLDEESTHLLKDLNSETPNKYPNAPHSSPIDLQNDPDGSVFNAELARCLNELPVILLSLEERAKNGTPEISVFDAEDHSRSYMESSTDTERKSCRHGEFQFNYENGGKNCSKKNMTIIASGHHGDERSESSEPLSTSITNGLQKFDFLRVDSFGEFNTDFSIRSTLSDDVSMIANCASDASDVSLEDDEFASDDDSSCASRERIEFEALALDSSVHASVVRRFQHWKTLGRNKRALSLDEMNPSKILSTTEFSAPQFELAI